MVVVLVVVVVVGFISTCVETFTIHNLLRRYCAVHLHVRGDIVLVE